MLFNGWNDIYDIEEALSLVKREYFYHDSTYNQFRHFITLVNEYYPNNWHLCVYKDNNVEQYSNSYGVNAVISGTYWKEVVPQFFIYIKFDELLVSNSKDESVTIKDLVIKLHFHSSGDCLNLYEVRGSRFTVTGEEYLTGYTFSHLSGTSRGSLYFCSFCFGSTNEAMRILRESLMNDYDEDVAEQFLLQWEPYLTWESIEGGPHKNMRDVLEYSPNASISRQRITIEEVISKNFSCDGLRELFRRILFTMEEYPLTSTNFLSVSYIDGISFTEDSIENLILGVSSYSEDYIYYEASNGNLFRQRGQARGEHPLSEERLMQLNLAATPMAFRGTQLKLVITNPVLLKDEEVVTYTKRVYPKIINYVKSRLEDFYKEETHKNNIIKRENFGRNSFGIYAKSAVSLQQVSSTGMVCCDVL